MAKLVVVGSLNMDLVVRTPRLPAPGETIVGRDFSTVPGGKGANQAVAAARLGAAVKLVGRLGRDDFGRILRAGLDKAGVNAEFVLDDDKAATGVAVIGVEDSGQNAIILAPGANARVTNGDVDAARAAIAEANVLVVQLETPVEAVEHALRLARAAKVLTILNPAPAQPLSQDLLSLVDVIVPNETEAALLTGLPVVDATSAAVAAQELQRRGARTVIITLGARGALLLDETGAHQVPAFKVTPIDATAAGDAFVAALAVALSRQYDLETALREASAAGALSSTRMGAQPSLPTRAQLDEFLSLAKIAEPS